MVAFTKTILFAAVALLIPSAVLAQTEIPVWPESVSSADGAADPEYYALSRRSAAPAPPAPAAGELTNGERLARGLAPRGPDRMYRPRAAAQPAYSPAPPTAMSRTYYRQYCVNTISSKTQLGDEITGVSTARATNICAARADGAPPNGFDSFAITQQPGGGYLCYAQLDGFGAQETCTAFNYAYYVSNPAPTS